MKETEKEITKNAAGEEKNRKAEAEKVAESAKKLLGGASFGDLINEIASVAPVIEKTGNYGLFSSRAYLFSIGNGCGLSTYLKYFADFIASTGLMRADKINVIEQRLGSYGDGPAAFENVFMVISNGGLQGVTLFCIDISEWMDKTESAYFKQFLNIIEKLGEKFVFVFRVPYIDKDILRRIEYSLSDLMSVKTVTFPPITKSDVESYVIGAFESYGFGLDDKAKEMFFVRLAKERNDGKFYGMNTVNKLTKEIAYKKLLIGGTNIITAEDMAKICDIGNCFMSGREELDLLSCSSELKQKVVDTAAEIEKILKAGTKDLVNVRLVGDAGTGKTTVARIIGKLLRESGALKIGALYEYEGKNLIGNYVGETAPKVSAICRDAKGSVLFIDNPQSFGDNDYGREALTALETQILSRGNEFVVIMAGYREDFEAVDNICQNFGKVLPFTIEFPKFTKQELYRIFATQARKYPCDDEMLSAAEEYFLSLPDSVMEKRDFSNARFVENLLSRTLAKAELNAELDGTAEIRLRKEDFICASKEKDLSFDIPKKAKMGFSL